MEYEAMFVFAKADIGAHGGKRFCSLFVRNLWSQSRGQGSPRHWRRCCGGRFCVHSFPTEQQLQGELSRGQYRRVGFGSNISRG